MKGPARNIDRAARRACGLSGVALPAVVAIVLLRGLGFKIPM